MIDAKMNGSHGAFPLIGTAYEKEFLNHGLTKRELIAAMQEVPSDLSMSWGELMVGPCPNRDENGNHVFDVAVIHWWAQVEARYRVLYADALLAALQEPRS